MWISDISWTHISKIHNSYIEVVSVFKKYTTILTVIDTTMKRYFEYVVTGIITTTHTSGKPHFAAFAS